jgi:hypothetical protein
MNPMGKGHVTVLLDEYLRFDADGRASRAVATAATRVEHVPGAYRVALVIADDAKGGWTNRCCAEFSHRFEGQPLFKRGWLVGLFWTSEPPDAQEAEREAATAAYRGAYLARQGQAHSLREMLAQEGCAMALAGCTKPTLDADGLEYTRAIVASHLESRDRAALVPCLFGDAAARTPGYPPQGLSERAGLALALHDAHAATGARRDEVPL